jgi:hypothetical protein
MGDGRLGSDLDPDDNLAGGLCGDSDGAHEPRPRSQRTSAALLRRVAAGCGRSRASLLAGRTACRSARPTRRQRAHRPWATRRPCGSRRCSLASARGRTPDPPSAQHLPAGGSQDACSVREACPRCVHRRGGRVPARARGGDPRVQRAVGGEGGAAARGRREAAAAAAGRLRSSTREGARAAFSRRPAVGRPGEQGRQPEGQV